jgi:hypothetical protein
VSELPDVAADIAQAEMWSDIGKIRYSPDINPQKHGTLWHAAAGHETFCKCCRNQLALLLVVC